MKKEVDEMNETNGKLTEYLDLVKNIKRQVNEPELVAALVTEISKDRRVQEMRAERKAFVEVSHDNGDNGNDLPATVKQKEFLLDLNVAIPKGLTKRQASELLEQALAQRA
jgi:hypothetical protein